ncbi:hypothetical protein IIC68_02390, partial [archaeon]|nr:hypothetical protein [archaeon]
MNKSHLLCLILILIITPTVLGADELVYLRGTSAQTTVDSTTYNTIDFIPPNVSATTTVISKTTSSGINELATWYGNPRTEDVQLSGSMFVYFSNIGISNDTGTYRWTIYERDEVGGAETQIVQSDWYTLPTPGTAHETYANISSYTIKNGNRAKFVIEYNADAGGGTIAVVLDEGNSGQSVSYSAPNGNTYTINDVKNSVYVLVNTSGS